MSTRGSARLAWGLCGLDVVLTLAAVGMILANPDRTSRAATIVTYLTYLAFPTAGALIASRQPSNAMGWLFLGVGLTFAVDAPILEFALLSAATHAASLGVATRLLAAASGWWAVVLVLIAVLALLLFPDGHLPSRRWRVVAWTAGAAMGLVTLTAPFLPDATAGNPGVPANPFAVSSPVVSGLNQTGAVLLTFMVPASVVALVRRRRRAQGIERDQLRWFALGGTVLGLCVFVGVIFDSLGHPDARSNIIGIGILAIPITAGIGILRYRLFDIDVVIKKTIVFAVLAVLLTGGFLVVALIAGAVVVRIGNEGFWSPPILVATAFLLGLLIAPLLRLSRRIADRLVYGGRASAYEVLTAFGGRIGETYAMDDVLTRMAEVLASGTGASAARVLLRVGDSLHAVGVAGTPGGDPLLTPVVHHGEELGALAVEMPANDPMTPAKERLVSDLAAQAGPVLRNVQLIEELKASRQRLVAAQDEERRKLERNIHDGVQQQLVALNVQLGLLARVAERDPGAVAQMSASLQGRATEALEDLRDLARGIYPPLLADKGLAAALESQGRKAAVPVRVEAGGIGRYPAEVEATVYFCTLEALNNVAKYAQATLARIELTHTDGHLSFTVTDDGVGFDAATASYGTGLQGMADRLAALGGVLDVRSAPGEGTTVTGRVRVP